jgi:hypothetical protein
MKKRSITAEEFDKKFDEGHDITPYLDLTKVEEPGIEQYRVNVDFPVWMVQKLDAIARRLGVTRQSVIKIFISEKLKEESL